jgi:glycosyltransferase involved in cell wall biosynthesis
MKILHIINTLEQGGAEKILYKIIKYDEFNKHYIFCLKDGNFFNLKNNRNNLEIIKLKLNKFNIFIKLFYIFNIVKYFKKINIDVIHTWNYHSDFVGYFFSLFLKKKIVWNIVNYDISSKNKFLTYLLIRINGIISNYKRLEIVNCSYKSIINHLHIFKNKNVKFVPIGFKILDENNLKQIKKKYRNDFITFGFFARFHPVKNFDLLFKVINILLYEKKYTNVQFLIGGSGVNYKNIELISVLEQYKLLNKNQVKIIEHIREPTNFYQKINYLILTSKSEGFPNSVGEAMSSAVPIISSNVGDIEALIDDKNFIFNINQNNHINKLLQCILHAIRVYKNEKTYYELCLNVQNKIKNDYNLNKMIQEYKDLWSQK